MRKHKVILCFLLWLMLPVTIGLAQRSVYNADIYAGLPSNHAYMMVKDALGYLWIATEKGVVRYNGYAFKTYNLANGLSTNDVWGLLLDKKQRLWLYNFSGQIGYIQNNHYKSSYFRNNERTIYPYWMTRRDSGIIFMSRGPTVCYEQQDTISTLKGITGNVFAISNRSEILSWTSIGEVRIYGLKDGKVFLKSMQQIDEEINASKLRWLAYDHYLVFYSYQQHYLKITDLRNGRSQTRYLTDSSGRPDNIAYASYNAQDHMMLICEKNIYELDHQLNTRILSISGLTGNSNISGYKITYLLEDQFWGNCTSTASDGLYFNYPDPGNFESVPVTGMINYRFTGNAAGKGYWWNNSTNTMMSIDTAANISSRRYQQLVYIRKIIPYDQHYALLTGNDVWWYNYASGDVAPFNTGHLAERFHMPAYLQGPWLNVLALDSFTLYMNRGDGFSRSFVSRDTMKEQVIDEERYPNISWDSITRIAYVYNTESLLIYKNDSSKLKLSGDDLRLLGLKKIEQVLADRYGHIFLKDCDKVLVYDLASFSCRRIMNNYNLNDAALYLAGDLLIATAKAGILFYRVGPGSDFSKPVFYPNIKERYYKSASDCQVLGKRLFLNTDKGLYSCRLPADSSFRQQTTNFFLSCQLIVSCNGNLQKARPGDVLQLEQEDSRLQLDIIKPSGNGMISYSRYLPGKDTAWQKLNGNELDAGFLAPGILHPLWLRAQDEVWNGDPVLMYIMIRPYWWQTDNGQRLIAFCVLLLLTILVLLTVMITHKIVLRRNTKRTQILELQIKSMYAQINPHFIFNSLNAGLHMITNGKPDAAYRHISRFSHLLRAYLKSSRHRYITLADEIKNLEYYIELQQTRFAAAFSYSIRVVDIEEPASLQIPSLLLQPIVENAIDHGLLPREDGEGRLEIEFRQDSRNRILYCRIEDNGIGRARSGQYNKDNFIKEGSYGNQLIKDLVSLFNQYEQMGIEITYIDQQPPHTGTIVMIKIKNPHHG